MFCKNCGKEITDDTLFCPNCGVKIEETNGLKGCEINSTGSDNIDSNILTQNNKDKSNLITKYKNFIEKYEISGLSIVIVIIWIILLSGFILYNQFIYENTPEKITEKYIEYIENNNYDKIQKYSAFNLTNNEMFDDDYIQTLSNVFNNGGYISNTEEFDIYDFKTSYNDMVCSLRETIEDPSQDDELLQNFNFDYSKISKIAILNTKLIFNDINDYQNQYDGSSVTIICFKVSSKWYVAINLDQ